MSQGSEESSLAKKSKSEPRVTSCEELQHRLDHEMVKRLTLGNPRSLPETDSCVCCGSNFARAFKLQASLVKLFARRDNYSPEERRFMTQGDLIAWCTASVGCDAATALVKLEDIRQTYRRLHLEYNKQCSICLHRPGFHLVQMAGLDRLSRPVIYSTFDPAASLGLTMTGLPSYLTHLFNCVSESLQYLPPTQHGVSLFFDCAALGPEHFTVESVSTVAEMLKLLPCRITYVMLGRLKYLHRRLLTPLLYLTGLEDRVFFLSSDISRKRMVSKLRLLYTEALANWISKQCVDDE